MLTNENWGCQKNLRGNRTYNYREVKDYNVRINWEGEWKKGVSEGIWEGQLAPSGAQLPSTAKGYLRDHMQNHYGKGFCIYLYEKEI